VFKVITIFVLVMVGDAFMALLHCPFALRHWISQCWDFAKKEYHHASR